MFGFVWETIRQVNEFFLKEVFDMSCQKLYLSTYNP